MDDPQIQSESPEDNTAFDGVIQLTQDIKELSKLYATYQENVQQQLDVEGEVALLEAINMQDNGI